MPTSAASFAPDGVALGTFNHRLPFQRAMSGVSAPPGVRGADPESPTATQLFADLHSTCDSASLCAPATAGPATLDHVVPFQRSANALSTNDPLIDAPTARQLVVVAQDTPAMMEARGPEGVGIDMIDHAVPFHRSLIEIVVVWVDASPVATQSLGAGQLTAERLASTERKTSALGTTDQTVPFHRSISALVVVSFPASPTAMQLAAEVHETLANVVTGAWATSGVGTIDQVAPFQPSASVRDAPLNGSIVTLPTAMHDVGVGQETLWRTRPADIGVGTIDQSAPSHTSASAVLYPLPTPTQRTELAHETDVSTSCDTASGERA